MVQTLQDILLALTNNPAGLKLSLPLSRWLSGFFQYWVAQYGKFLSLPPPALLHA